MDTYASSDGHIYYARPDVAGSDPDANLYSVDNPYAYPRDLNAATDSDSGANNPGTASDYPIANAPAQYDAYLAARERERQDLLRELIGQRR
jgi:hypothetical protein